MEAFPFVARGCVWEGIPVPDYRFPVNGHLWISLVLDFDQILGVVYRNFGVCSSQKLSAFILGREQRIYHF